MEEVGFTEPKCYSIYGDLLNGVIALNGNKFYNKEYAKRKGIGFYVRINISSCVVFVRIFVEFRRLNVGIYVGEGGYCGDI